MPRLFVGNFDFEHRLARPAGTLPQSVQRINAELPPVWATIADDGDYVWTPVRLDPEVFDRLAALGFPHLRPVSGSEGLDRANHPVFWGENEWANKFAADWRLPWTGCDPAVVRRVNSRRFKFALERRLRIALPGSALVENADELTEAVSTLRGGPGWVLKGEFGGAGREVRFGAGPVSSADLAWAETRYRLGLAITVEPRLESVEEAGLQFEIGRGRSVTFLGVTPLLTRRSGGYLASRFDEDAALLTTWREAIETAHHIAEAVAAEGYFGPLGIDAMRYRAADGTIRTRPLQDLNARFTMGRLALGLRRFPVFSAAIGQTFHPQGFKAEIAD